ncbi:unnamed protein product [Schistosoma margrebowiei]|uniref:Uncharacterized protein n=1 Tax=Schistosoma margrebowiei TaxID=48269 RepID=A0A3P7VHC8_9TREM|nr:unnamed protein product [Schistosoma margrebowiei]
MVWNHGFPTPLGRLSMSTNPFKELDVRFSSSQFRKQHLCHEKAVSRTSMAEAIYAWPCESISRGRADSLYSRPYQGIGGLIVTHLRINMNGFSFTCYKLVDGIIGIFYSEQCLL